MELRVISFRQGSPENFLSGVQTALEKIWQKGLLAANEQACKEDKEAEKKLVTATEAYISYQGVDESFPVKKHWKMQPKPKHTSYVFMWFLYFVLKEPLVAVWLSIQQGKCTLFWKMQFYHFFL